jgi:hypothetical protein
MYNLGENHVQRLVPGLPELRRALLQAGSVPELDASLAEAMAARGAKLQARTRERR